MRLNKYPMENHERLCHGCLCTTDEIETFEISRRGFGSMFDMDTIKIQLCPDCIEKYGGLEHLKRMFEETGFYTDEDKFVENYVYEEELSSLIDTLEPEGKEIVMNTTIESPITYKIDPQDYIDMTVCENKLEKLKRKYGLE